MPRWRTGTSALLSGFWITMLLTTLILLTSSVQARSANSNPKPFELTIDNIMRGPELIGQEPRGIRWSSDGATLLFTWRAPSDNGSKTYEVNADGSHMGPAPEGDQFLLRQEVPSPGGGEAAYLAGNDVMLRTAGGTIRKVTKEDEERRDLTWMADGKHIAFTSGNSEVLLALDSGEETELCRVTPGQGGAPPAQGGTTTAEETPSRKALAAEQAELFPGAGQRRGFPGGAGGFNGRSGRRNGGNGSAPTGAPNLQLKENQRALNFQASPDASHTAVPVFETTGDSKNTVVPNYITASGYTEDINSYPKVGDVHFRSTLAVTSKDGKAVWMIPPDAVGKRDFSVRQSQWAGDGKTLTAIVETVDHKDRWLVKIAPDSGDSTVLFADHCDAWLGGPGGGTLGWLPDKTHVFFESEKDGWAHLYTVDVTTGETKQLTSGSFEVSGVHLSKDGKTFYFVSSEGSPFRRHLDSVPIGGGPRTRLLPVKPDESLNGNTPIYFSPDESHVAYLRSWVNHPPELFVAKLGANSSETKVTESPSAEWSSFSWVKPELVEVPASDGTKVPGHFYKPLHARRGGPAVIFVHGAGYLQNVHDWWKGSYYLEYMFHHVLAEHGVAVLDLDYRASAGYGRDWRTAVYRFMGGRDLDDQVDGAAWLVKQKGVDPKRIGIYGGSYGGFITLMAMFTKPGVFAAGAALRPVSDWANYNDGYTSDILNLPQDDKEAYRRSSPIFHAEGLTGKLLICHGVVDTNVHYQDTVRLVQRLIDLRKENWSVAFYPMEDHTFARQTSWA
ncbi:MAG TPA: prolyl oligopeptidase family serine peptidase, partial [Fimbriimonadaceae bacterium]|nr:prolyl oligopeptidase family serine peptidase [Fimbriimonadaceae bacterium]